ncbi:MAG: molybdopterin-dependent oxidoreductase [Thermodesulfobacteriota bacterium]|nr:molybdopterin-dependent oxidoreductase [Thermodesulfobacteriota bacterium]
MYAKNPPAYITSGNALELHIKDFQAIRTIMLLHALTGNVDVKGGEFIPGEKIPLVDIELKGHNGDVFKGISTDRYPPYLGSEEDGNGKCASRDYPHTQPYPIKALIVVGRNPIVTGPNSSHQRKAYKKLNLMVAVDLFMTETAKMGDILLPAASFLEGDNLKVGDRIYMIPKIIAPQGDAWPEWKFWFELAKKMGYTNEFPWATPDEAIDEHLSSINVTASYPRKNFIGGKYKEKVVCKKHEEFGFQTPSGKVEFYSQTLADASYDPLPTYIKHI